MKSSSGAHFIALDHIRALAAFMVFTWHFIHGPAGDFPVPTGYAPAIFPLSVLDQGHTGVALFMCLSGYLFKKFSIASRLRIRPSSGIEFCGCCR
jgi:peptidoglycan/LPS O-acetylase OafA/YrhL